eukprot:6191668-Pleurochrysis_carterae.AAC.1
MLLTAVAQEHTTGKSHTSPFAATSCSIVLVKTAAERTCHRARSARRGRRPSARGCDLVAALPCRRFGASVSMSPASCLRR